MATSAYGSLLLKDYRQKKGDLLVIKKEIRELARKAIDLEGHVAALASIIRLRDPTVDLETAVAIRTTPRVRDMKHGTLTKRVLTLLKAANGMPVSREEIFSFLLDQMEVVPSRQEQALIRVAIRYCMKRLARQGKVLAHPPSKNSLFGCWSLPASLTPPSTRVVPGRAASNP